MPVISMFFGIIITMFYQDHEPPHFHVEHQGQRAKVDFDGEIVAGSIRSRTARQLIREWTQLHRTELEANWTHIKLGRALQQIPPLD